MIIGLGNEHQATELTANEDVHHSNLVVDLSNLIVDVLNRFLQSVNVSCVGSYGSLQIVDLVLQYLISSLDLLADAEDCAVGKGDCLAAINRVGALCGAVNALAAYDNRCIDIA